MPHDQCPMAIALKENRPVRGSEALAERPDGSRVAFVPYPTPLRDDAGALVGAVNVLVDVTERRRAVDELRSTAEALRASNAVKDEFLGLVSHELRTPVTTIFGNARLLQDRAGKLADGMKEAMIGDIAIDAERLLGVIENLLVLTRLGSGAELDLEPQVLDHIVRKAVEAFRRRQPCRPLDFHTAEHRVIVEADRTYVELLVENLLSNAHKYSPPDAEVTVVLRVEDGEAEVAVLDRGIGIADADHDRLFEPFYRGQAARGRADGIGIGLAVCARVAAAQGGRVWARSREGGGAEIGFSLPLTPDGRPD
jgi:signal transduction histidine kinase